jgi:hypothetical protein
MNPDDFKNLSPVFILGIARSGTTLLQSLLDGHPQLLVDIYDSRFVYWYRQVRRWPEKLRQGPLSPARRMELAEQIMLDFVFHEASPYYQDFLGHISIPALKGHFRAFLNASPGQPKNYLEAYLYALGLASGHLSGQTRFWVDKTLGYEYLFNRYAQWFPNARFIYMIRDPRDVYTSYKKRDIKNNRAITAIESFAVTWGDSARALLDCQRNIPPENRFILRYEDLVADPQTVMKSVADFLGIDFTPGLLSPTKGFGRVPWGGNPESGKKQTGVVYQDAARKWQTYLQPEELARLEFLLGPEMQAVGYSLAASPRAFPLASAQVAARRALFKLVNLGL